MATKVNKQGLEDDLTIYLESGSQSTPSLSFTDSTNSGVYRNTSDSSINISIAGTTVAKFRTDGIGLLSSTNTPRADIDLGYVTNGLVLPVGTTAQRVSNTPGTIRFNSSLDALEYRNNTTWVPTGKVLSLIGENYLTLTSDTSTDIVTVNPINLSGNNVTNILPTSRGGTGRIDITSTEYGYLNNVTSNIQTQLNSKQATITGAATTIVSSNLTSSRALVSDSSGKVSASVITSTELGYLDNVTSNIQTQLNGKQATITGAASTIVSSNLTTDRVLISNGSGKVSVSTVTDTELGHLSGVTSAIQTQLNSKASLSSPTFTGTVTLPSTTSIGNVSSTEIGYLDGVTSSIQTQLNNIQSNITGLNVYKFLESKPASGSFIDFNIPSNINYLKFITYNIRHNSIAVINFSTRFGTIEGLDTSSTYRRVDGYLSSGTTSASGSVENYIRAGVVVSSSDSWGVIEILKVSGNNYVLNATSYRSNGDIRFYSGTKTLNSEIRIVRFYLESTLFNAGTINCYYM